MIYFFESLEASKSYQGNWNLRGKTTREKQAQRSRSNIILLQEFANSKEAAKRL